MSALPFAVLDDVLSAQTCRNAQYSAGCCMTYEHKMRHTIAPDEARGESVTGLARWTCRRHTVPLCSAVVTSGADVASAGGDGDRDRFLSARDKPLTFAD